ncbi:hypothetical protein [Nitrosomonas mobilis]|uniref:hypothetical protein n=1 Tax=Nitrosomonas mobilis TaxID=51642 RepID=UPI000B7FF42E|nr:hypothetical protein [Nitrosomonas mobilis]
MEKQRTTSAKTINFANFELTMSIHSFCKPRQSVFATDRRATVLNLDTFLKDQVDGVAFFEENFFTNTACSYWSNGHSIT